MSIAGFFRTVMDLTTAYFAIAGGNGGKKNEMYRNSDGVYPNLSSLGFSLFAELATANASSSDNSNVLISPYCIASVLSMAAAGSTPSSTCQAELYDALGIKNSHKEMATLRSMLQSSSSGNESSGVQLTTANSVWTTKSIKPEYEALVESAYGAAAKDLPSQYEPIDNWISEQTNGLVSNVLSGDVDPLIVAVLVSIVHFHGIWAEKFDTQATTDGTFYASDGKPKEAKFMRTMRSMDVLTGADFLGGASALRMNYDNGGKEGVDNQFCALFILPPENTTESMREVITSLARNSDYDGNGEGEDNGDGNDVLYQTLQMLTERNVRLSLPKFRAEWGASSLKESLMNRINIKAAFTGREIFSAMSDDPELYLDDVVHKVVMEVTEEGTTAAAAGAVIMGLRSLPRDQIDFTFDRPFVMIILHTPTSTPMFIAKLDNPDFIL